MREEICLNWGIHAISTALKCRRNTGTYGETRVEMSMLWDVRSQLVLDSLQMCENLRKVTTYRHTVSQSWRWCRRSANHCGSEACYWYRRSLGDRPFMVEFLHTPEIGDVLMGIGVMQCQASTLVPNLCSHAASQVVWVFQLASRTCLSSSRLLMGWKNFL